MYKYIIYRIMLLVDNLTRQFGRAQRIDRAVGGHGFSHAATATQSSGFSR